MLLDRIAKNTVQTLPIVRHSRDMSDNLEDVIK